MTTESLFKNPRFAGVQEQNRRARWFLEISRTATDEIARFRVLMAAVYAARAAIEIMLEAAEKQELNAWGDRKKYENELVPKIPFYHLVEKIRIHDFHRFGCLPPDESRKVSTYQGPLQLTAANGMAVLGSVRKLNLHPFLDNVG